MANLSNPMKVRADLAQRQKLLRLMERNFYSGGRQYDFKNKKVIWNEITAILNTLGPPRSCAKWRKFWTDTLLRVRKKIILRDSGRGDISKKVEFTRDDLEILRITGGEKKLIREFKPRSFCNQIEKVCDILAYNVDDSSREPSEVEITNQPLSENYYEVDENESRNSSDDLIAIDNDERENRTNVDSELNESSKIEVKELPTNSYNEYNTSDCRSYSQTALQYNARKRQVSATHSTKYPTTKRFVRNENELQHFDQDDWGESNYDYNENVNNLENEENSPLTKLNSLQSHYNQSTCNEEILTVQKETLTEIRKMNELQQETNQLLKILINKLDHNANDTFSQPSAELDQNELKDISQVIIKKEI